MGYWTEGKHSDYNVLNDGYMNDLLMGPNSVNEKLPGEYEIYTVFIRRTSDLRRLDPRQLRAMMKGKNVIAWYFVWPSTCDNSDWEFRAGNFVDEKDFFQLVQAMEHVPLRTG